MSAMSPERQASKKRSASWSASRWAGSKRRSLEVRSLAGAGGELAGVDGSGFEEPGDLFEVVAEDFAEEERGALGRRECFEEDEEGHREGLGEVAIGWSGAGPVVGDGLGEPGAVVFLVALALSGGDRCRCGWWFSPARLRGRWMFSAVWRRR